MSYFYSGSKNSFLDASLMDAYQDAGNWPDDCVEVSDEMFAEFAIAEAPAGKVRAVGKNGEPTWIDAPAASKEQLQAEASAQKAYLMGAAAVAMAPLQDAMDLGVATDEELSNLTAWKKYRVALNRVDQQAGYPEKVKWPAAPATGS